MNNLLITHYYPPGFFIVKTNLSPEDWLAQASQLAWERKNALSPETLDLEEYYYFHLHYDGNDYKTAIYESAKDITNSYKAEFITIDFAEELQWQIGVSFGVCGPLFLPQHHPEYDWGTNKRG